jgi:xylan 1,4-beta-xylosidase
VRWRLAVPVCFIAACSIVAIRLTPAPAQAPAPETITLDLTAPAHPFPHFWERMFGSGRAILSLRDDYRRDLRAVKAITGFEYVRFHAIFHDEVGVYSPAGFNFSYVDQIYDGLLANNVRPFVELSFMPKDMAANQTPHAFWYKPYPSPPKDPAQWARMIDAFVRHLIARYGAGEVEQWYFEVWNEPNIDFWTGKPAEETYYALYDLTARTIKQVDPLLRVGGPSTAQAAWVDRFIAHCAKASVPFDFVSTHIYGNEAPKDVFGVDGPVDFRNMVARALKKVHDQVAQSAAANTPIFISEFNAAYLNRVDIEDSAFMGPWLADTIRATDGLVSMMSYWTFSDVFEEQGVVKTPFYGGFGLIAERGIPKPAFRVFELLHRLGGQRLDSPPGTLLTKGPDGRFVLALWDYADPGQAGAPRSVRLQFTHGRVAKYRLQAVDDTHSALAAWNGMGKPESPTPEQITRLVAAAQLAPAQEHAVSEVIQLASHELALVELR